MKTSMKTSVKTFQPARRRLTRAIALALTLTAGSVSALEVTGSFTGWWGQPEQENQGLIVSISRLPSGEKTGVVYWAHYDEFGKPSWLFAQGPIQGDTIAADVYAVDGVTFMQPDDPSNNPAREVGSMQIRFSDCVNGSVSFQTGADVVGNGNFRVARLTDQPGTNCSGGISDDRNRNDDAEEIDTPLLPTGVIPGASGEAKFEATARRIEFDVEIEDVPLGEYQLLVGGELRGMITVTDTPDGPEGEIEYGSPRDDDELLLDFDPRDQIIEILQGSTVVLEGISDATGSNPGNGDDDSPEFGNGEIEIDLVNSGLFPAGSGDAEFEQESDRVDFEVEIEDVPVGPYALFVGGVERGTIEVVDTLNGSEGEIEFRTPFEAGKLPLDFDPRGELIEVLDAGGLAFSADFPLEDTGDDSGDDDSGDDDSGDDDSGDDDSGDDDSGDDDSGEDDSGDDDSGDDDSGDDDSGDDSGDGDGTQTSIEIELDNGGVYPLASGDADYQAEDGERDFSVEIEDVPVGNYRLVIDGMDRAAISVSETDDGTEGEIEFSDPQDDDLLLDFDPLGATIEVFDGETLILSAEFPTT